MCEAYTREERGSYFDPTQPAGNSSRPGAAAGSRLASASMKQSAYANWIQLFYPQPGSVRELATVASGYTTLLRTVSVVNKV